MSRSVVHRRAGFDPSPWQRAAVWMLALLLAGCQPSPPQALGTLERDRISLPATRSEPLLELLVHKGDAVKGGQLLMRFDDRPQRANLASVEAERDRLLALLDLVEAGPRVENIDEARARLNGAQSRAANARAELTRVESLLAQGLIARSPVDQARAESQSADAEARIAAAALRALQSGSRPQEIEQARAALHSTQARIDALQIDLQRLTVVAPRDGIVDGLPFHVGDQPPMGAPVAMLLVGDRPFVRAYVPQSLRVNLSVGDSAVVQISGREETYTGRLRWIASESSFTPYFALTGDDAQRLSYLADVDLDEAAGGLPVGLPVTLTFPVDASSRARVGDGH